VFEKARELEIGWCKRSLEVRAEGRGGIVAASKRPAGRGRMGDCDCKIYI